jgi:hypothetical protein
MKHIHDIYKPLTEHPLIQKQTLQSTGIWEAFRRFLAIDPERSNGVPLNPHFRNPPPGANDPLQYDDPVTLPAGDIADNPYWKRDNRRGYPQLSVVDQSQFAQLITIGSAEAPARSSSLLLSRSPRLVWQRHSIRRATRPRMCLSTACLLCPVARV